MQFYPIQITIMKIFFFGGNAFILSKNKKNIYI